MNYGRALTLLVAVTASCSGAKEPAEPPPGERGVKPQPAAVPVGDQDASTGKPASSDEANVGTGAAETDLHFDSARSSYQPRTGPSRRSDNDKLELLLRSSPPGAQAAIDGKTLGTTPVLWRGRASGQPHEFTFVLPGYSLARYRFTPVRSGIVHGTLKRLTTRVMDAGVPSALPADAELPGR